MEDHTDYVNLWQLSFNFSISVTLTIWKKSELQAFQAHAVGQNLAF